jgi:dihydrolipoamide dehydrogenase
LNELEELKHLGLLNRDNDYDLNKIRDYKNNVVNKLTVGLKGLAKQRRVDVIIGDARVIDKNSVLINNQDKINQKLENSQHCTLRYARV